MYYVPGAAVYEDAEVLERIFEYEAALPEAAVKKESGNEETKCTFSEEY